LYPHLFLACKYIPGKHLGKHLPQEHEAGVSHLSFDSSSFAVSNLAFVPVPGVSHLGYAMAFFDAKNRVTFGFDVCVL